MENKSSTCHMTNEQRLIDVNKEIQKIQSVLAEHPDEQGTTAYYAFSALVECLKKAPTVDAVEVKCKVGDWVYALWEAPVKQKYIIYCAEVKEIRIGMRNCRLTTTYILEPIMYRGHRKEYRHDDFGKLVFLSEDEAEAALAKMDGGNEDG